MNGDTERQCKCRSGADRTTRQHAGQHYTHRHPLRDIMQRNRQHQHRRFAQAAGFSLRALRIQVKMGHKGVQQKEETHTAQKTGHSRHPRDNAGRFGHINGRDQQRPYRGRDHHTGGKAQ